MTISIKLKFAKKDINKKWVYLGKDIKKYIYLKKTLLDKNELNINIIDKNIIHNKIISYSSSLRKLNGNSIFWNGSHHYGPNNLMLDYYYNLENLIKITHFIYKIPKDKNFIIYVDDYYVAELYYVNLIKKRSVKINKFYKILIIPEILSKFLKSISQFFRNSLKLLIFILITKIYIKNNKKIKLGKVLLFHLCIDMEYLNNNSIIATSRYFNNLPNELIKKGFKVRFLPWFNSIDKNFFKNFNKTNKDLFLHPDLFLNIKDYFKVYIYSIKSSFTINKITQLDNLNISPLVKMEKFNNLTFENIFFYRYLFFIKKYFNKKINLHIYDHFENMPFDNILRYAKKFLPNYKIKNIGYCHSIVSKNYYGYKLENENDLNFFNIDRIVTNSDIFTQYLLTQNFSNEFVFTGASLRQSSNLRSVTNKKNKDFMRNILIILPLNYPSCLELLQYVSVIFQNLLQCNYKVYFKKHPSMKESLFNKLMIEFKFNNFLIFNKNLSEHLNEFFCTVNFDSSSILDILISDSLPIIISSNFQPLSNNIDIIENRFEICKAIDGAKLFQKIEYYKKNYYTILKNNNTLKKYLNESMSDLNDNNINIYTIND